LRRDNLAKGEDTVQWSRQSGAAVEGRTHATWCASGWSSWGAELTRSQGGGLGPSGW